MTSPTLLLLVLLAAIVVMAGHATAAVFSVSAYGARPNTGTDQYHNISRALSAAVAAGNSVLLFDLVGEYHISQYSPSLIMIIFWTPPCWLAGFIFYSESFQLTYAAMQNIGTA